MITDGTNIDIPDSLIVGGGNVYLSKTSVTELPIGLTVNGHLYLCNTKITEVPEGLTVSGNLSLGNTKITELPEGLTVGTWLDLSNTEITELPVGLTVGDVVYSDNKLIASEELQLRLINQSEHNFDILKYPTDNAKRLHEMLWVI